MVVHLDQLAHQLDQRWARAPGAAHLHLLPPSAAFCPPVTADAAVLLDEMLQRLNALAASAAAMPQEARLWAWADDRYIRLELRTTRGLDRTWHLARAPLLGVGGVRHPFQRLAASSRQPARHCRWGAPESVCVLTPMPATVELARGMVLAVNLRGLWATASAHRARQWLAQHPRCPLLLVETGPGVRLWLLDPRQPLSSDAPCLVFPILLSSLVVAARKFYASR